MIEMLTHVVSDSVIIYEGRDSTCYAVCRAKLNLTSSSAAGCISNQLLEWVQYAQDNENMEPTQDGSTAGAHALLAGGSRHLINLGRFTCDESRISESVKGPVTHVTCSALCTICGGDSKMS